MQNAIFMGAGAIGSYVGGWLARGGLEVTLVDGWGMHVDTMKADGLNVRGPHDPFNVKVQALHLHEASGLKEKFDAAFVAMKSYDTEWATHYIKRFVKPDGVVISAQNCWNDPVIASIVGEERTIGLIMSAIQVALWEAGGVERFGAMGRDRGHDVFRAGTLDGTATPQVEELIARLSVVDGAKVTPNLLGERWAKLAQNCMGNPTSAMTGLTVPDMAANANTRKVQILLGLESARVGLALGYDVTTFGGAPAARWSEANNPEVFAELDSSMAARASDKPWRPSMAQDVVKGRMTEIDSMNGYVVERAKEAGIDVPVSVATTNAVREIDAGTLKPAPEVADRVLAEAGL